jgi:hypothetical protein
MSILSGKSHARLPVLKPDDPAHARPVRVVCPRCQTINCARHSAGALTSRPTVPAWWGH